GRARQNALHTFASGGETTACGIRCTCSNLGLRLLGASVCCRSWREWGCSCYFNHLVCGSVVPSMMDFLVTQELQALHRNPLAINAYMRSTVTLAQEYGQPAQAILAATDYCY